MTEGSTPGCRVCGHACDVLGFDVLCSYCNCYVHSTCAGIREDQALRMCQYACPACAEKGREPTYIDPPSEVLVLPGMTASNTAAWYAAVVKHGNSLDDFRLFLRNATFPIVAIRHVAPEAITSAMVQCNGLRDPILMRGQIPGMSIPDDPVTPKDIPSLVGTSAPVRVGLANTSTLQPCSHDDLELLCRNDRFRRCLVEFPIADTPLERQFKAPSMVRDIDWFHQLNPTGLVNPNTFACVQGVASYRDFRMSPWGTSAWVSVGDGLPLTVFLIPPSPDNLAHFAANEKHKASRFTLLFMGNGMHGCRRVDLHPHDTLFIPPGWMWASNVRDDAPAATCVVFSGFFFHGFTLPAQVRLLQFHQTLVTRTDYATDWPLVSTIVEFMNPQPTTGTLHQVLKYWIWPAVHMYSRRVKKQRSMSPWENLGLFQVMALLGAITSASALTAGHPSDELSCGWFTGLTADNVAPILSAVEAHLRLKQETAASQLPQAPMDATTRPPVTAFPRLSQKSAVEFLNAFVTDITDSDAVATRAAAEPSAKRVDAASPRPARRSVETSSNSFLTPPGGRAAGCATCGVTPCRCKSAALADDSDADKACPQCQHRPCTCKTAASWGKPSNQRPAVVAPRKRGGGCIKPYRGPTPRPAVIQTSSRQPTRPVAAAPPDFDEWMTSPPVQLPPKPNKPTPSNPPTPSTSTEKKRPPPLPTPPEDFDLWETSQPVEIKPTNPRTPTTPSKAKQPPVSDVYATRGAAPKSPKPKPSTPAPVVLIDDDEDWFMTTEPIPVAASTKPRKTAPPRPSTTLPTKSFSDTSKQDSDDRTSPTSPTSSSMSSASSRCACPATFQRCTTCFNCIKFDCTCAAKCGCDLPKCPVCQNCFAAHCTCGPMSHATPLSLLARRDNEVRFIRAVQEQTLVLFNRSRQDVHDDLRALKFDTHEGDFEYLVSLPVSRFMQNPSPRTMSMETKHARTHTSESTTRHSAKAVSQKRAHDIVGGSPSGERLQRMRTRPRPS